MTGDMDDYVPLDTIFHILLWLPVSSLLRFKSVCKSWLSLIESSHFVHKHLHFMPSEPKTEPLFLSRSEFNNQQFSLVSVDTESMHTKSMHLLDFPITDDPYQIVPVKLVASCNGIICLLQDRRLYLWNPATKQCTTLPPLPVLSYHRYFGFGFDSKSNNYKLVALNSTCYPDPFLVHIYSSSSDSWRKFEGFGLPHGVIKSQIKAPLRSGIYCWLSSPVILTFDFSDEVFGNIPLPSIMTAKDNCVHDIFNLRENIAFIGDVHSGLVNLHCEIWMLSDYQVKESWTKLYSFEAIYRYFSWVTWLSANAEILLFRGGPKLVGLYDLVTRQLMKLPVHANDGFEFVMYRESLLSIKRGSGATNGVTFTDWNRRILINQSMARNNSWGDSDVHCVVVFHILLWLPVASLLRFKSVCKSWHSLIKSSDFVTQHFFLHHHGQDKNGNFNLILHSSSVLYDPLFEDSAHHSPTVSCTCLLSADKLELLDLPICESWWFRSPYIVTSFNGILCLKHSEDNSVYLWNPATKQLRGVLVEWLPNDDVKEFIGFGFDVKTNNYKLVRFCRGVDNDIQHVAGVYSLGTDSWRTIDDEILPTVESISSGLHEPYRDGIYCWLARTVDTTYSHTILSFDFSNEVFRTIPLPDSINKSSLTLALTVLRENIACILLGENNFSNDTENWHCEIWMMNEYGVKQSWIKLYMVGPFSKDWFFKMCYSKKNGDYILLLQDGQLHEYDLVTQETTRLPVRIKGPNNYQVVGYKESLVPVKSGYF